MGHQSAAWMCRLPFQHPGYPAGPCPRGAGHPLLPPALTLEDSAVFLKSYSGPCPSLDVMKMPLMPLPGDSSVPALPLKVTIRILPSYVYLHKRGLPQTTGIRVGCSRRYVGAENSLRMLLTQLCSQLTLPPAGTLAGGRHWEGVQEGGEAPQPHDQEGPAQSHPVWRLELSKSKTLIAGRHPKPF